MRILVTGGAGYVGSHCLRSLLNADHETVVLDDLSTGHRQSVDSRAEFVEGDLADDALLSGLFAAHRFAAVMHFAASLDVGESVREPLKYYRNNVANTVTLLEVMQEARVNHFIFSSSAAVYGEPVESGEACLNLQKPPKNGVVIAVVSNVDYLYEGEETRTCKHDYRIHLVEGVSGTASIYDKHYQ